MSKTINTAEFYNIVKDAQEEKEQIERLDLRKELRRSIEDDIKDSTGKRLELLKLISDMPDKSDEDFKAKEWLYNFGLLRTTEEIESYNKKIQNEEYYRKNWVNKKNYRVTDWKLFILQLFMIPLGVIISYNTRNFSFLIAAIVLKFILLIALIIHSAIMSSQTLYEAKLYNIPDSDPMVRNANLDKAALIIGGLNGAANICSHAKSSSKELMNPDAWTVNV